MTMARFADMSLEDLWRRFRGLRGEAAQAWPPAPRVLGMTAACLLAVACGGWFHWRGKLEARAAGRAECAQRKAAYQIKLTRVASLPALRARRAEIARRVAALERQLPGRTEMDALLADVNHAGIARGLTFELFRPQAAVIQSYYAEIPVLLRVSGRYHDVARFAADVAALPRIVTLQNLALTGNPDGSLVMEARVEAYRLLDASEHADSHRIGAAAGRDAG